MHVPWPAYVMFLPVSALKAKPTGLTTAGGSARWSQVVPFQAQVCVFPPVPTPATSITMTLRAASYVIEHPPAGGVKAGSSCAQVVPVQVHVSLSSKGSPFASVPWPPNAMNCPESESNAVHIDSLALGDVGGCCRVQIDPFQVHVSSSSPVKVSPGHVAAENPPNMMTCLVAPS